MHTLRDEIQERNAHFMICTVLRTVMICKSCDLDKKNPRSYERGFFVL